MLAFEKGPNDLIFQSKKPERSKIRPKLKGQTMVDTSETEKQTGQQCHGDTCCFGKRPSGRLSPALSRLSVLTQKRVGRRRSGFQTVSSHTCHTHLHSVLGIRAQAKTNSFLSCYCVQLWLVSGGCLWISYLWKYCGDTQTFLKFGEFKNFTLWIHSTT